MFDPRHHLDPQLLASALTYMHRRGPDGTRMLQAYDFTFLHCLLHLSGEVPHMQPILSEDESIVVLFNGEIYNYNQFVPNDACDSSCIIPCYEKYGYDFPKVLDGEFAIVLYDHKRRILLVTTDVFMTKPLHMCMDKQNRVLGFSSYASVLSSLTPHLATHMLQPNKTQVYDMNTMDVIQESPVYQFDLKQTKLSYDGWTNAFTEAVRKRATHGHGKLFVCMSSGYDSGCIVAALNQLKIPYATYSTVKGENATVLRDRLSVNKAAGTCLDATMINSISPEEFSKHQQKLKLCCEPFTYVHQDTPGSGQQCLQLWQDNGAVALHAICEKQSAAGYRVVLSGSGADEIFSDYGFNGRKIYAHSQFGGLFPDDLTPLFPWLKFYGDTQRSYLFKDEYVCGAHGMEGRYPFLDVHVVQEFLWLHPSLKNQAYKAPLRNYLEQRNYPFAPDQKTGFNI